MNSMQVELAARELCRLRGLDPDQSVGHADDPDENGIVMDVWLHSPAWTRVAREVVAWDQVRQAVEAAGEAMPPEDVTRRPT